MRLIRRFLADKGAATAVEYAVIAGFLFLTIVVSVRQFSTALDVIYTDNEQKLTEALDGQEAE